MAPEEIRHRIVRAHPVVGANEAVSGVIKLQILYRFAECTEPLHDLMAFAERDTWIADAVQHQQGRGDSLGPMDRGDAGEQLQVCPGTPRRGVCAATVRCPAAS